MRYSLLNPQPSDLTRMSAEHALSYKMHLEVYFQSALVRGVLETNQDRLSNYLIVRQGEQVFSLKEANLEMFNRKPVSVGADEYLVYLQEVLLIADLSTGEIRRGVDALHVQKDPTKAMLSVGPYLLHGKIHLRPGSAIHELLMEKSQFLPVTEAILIDRADVGQRTYLVNRTKIGFMSAIGDGLVEL